MNQSSGAMAALRIVLVGLLGGWALFVAGGFVQERGSGHGPATADTYDWSIYVFLAAVALFGGACLLGARRARRAAPAEPVLGRAAYHHAIAGLIVAAAAGALALAVVFFSLFASDPDTVLIRVVNAYLPIVAFTAVVVALLLAGVVFRGPAPTSPPAPGPPAPGPVAHLPPPADTRNSALAYAVPIIVAALAAIATGVVYDLTDTSLTAWV